MLFSLGLEVHFALVGFFFIGHVCSGCFPNRVPVFKAAIFPIATTRPRSFTTVHPDFFFAIVPDEITTLPVVVVGST